MSIQISYPIQQLLIRPVTSANPEHVVALYRSAGWWDDAADAPTAVQTTISGSFCVMGATDPNGVLVGMARAISDGVSDAYIQDVVVLPSYRSCGLGKKIVLALAEHCRNQKIPWIGLVAAPGLRDYYEKLGFQILIDHTPMIYKP